MLSRTFARIDTEEAESAEIGMTPLIDLVFLLLIFFITMPSTLSHLMGLPVEQARASTSQVLHSNAIRIVIHQDGRCGLDDQLLTIDAAIDSVKGRVAADSSAYIVIVPDRRGQVDPLVELMDRLREEGLSRFAIGTQPRDAARDQPPEEGRHAAAPATGS